MEPYERFLRADLILRDELAIDRTRLANERTFLAYARTAIMLVVSGVTLLKFFPQELLPEILGIALIPGGLAVALVGLLRFIKVSRSLGVLRLQSLQRPTPPPNQKEPQ